ncbi:MAG: flagellar hook-length control protein FliK [Ignavibacteriales bacterium]|nr:MAG: flagellar hook-length control protein FliK [Ignavibacteriales bacterium]
MYTTAISKILPVFDVIPVQEITLPKSALKINSLVDITVIDKAQSLYRILAGGKVFETRLPVPASIGENLLAIVVNNNPTVFRLNNLFGFIPGDKILSEVLMKLNLPITRDTKNILQLLIETDKPLLKSKIKKLAELIESGDTEIDKSSVELFAQLIWSAESFEDFDKKNLKHFYYSFEDLAQKILIELNHIYKKNPYDELFPSLNNWLIIQPETISGDSKMLLHIMKHFESSLSEWLDNNSELKNSSIYSLLNSYSMQTYYRKRAGLTNGMLLINTDDSLEYASYELKNAGIQDDTLFFKLQMNPSALGRINIEGYYSNGSMRVNFISTSDSKKIIEANSAELKNSLDKKARLISSITAHAFGQNDSTVITQTFSNRSINATA